MGVVFWKELADHFSSRRFMILLALIVLIGLWATYASGQAIRQDTENAPAQYVFLFLLTSGTGTVFSLATFLGFFGPIVGITLGFDSISGEYARGTLSRVLSQPIYRDSLINGKFFAGLATVGILWGSILLLVIGLGITLLGFPPTLKNCGACSFSQPSAFSTSASGWRSPYFFPCCSRKQSLQRLPQWRFGFSCRCSSLS